jgi:dTMP kinase
MGVRDRAPYPGVLIAICGLDGSGKTTQVQIIEDWLRPRYKVATFRPVTELFRNDATLGEYLHGRLPDFDPVDMAVEIALLAAADRFRQMRSRILPALRRGEVVIADRFVYSSYAWALARGLDDINWLRQLNRYLPDPDLTCYLDVHPDTALCRIRARGDTPRWEELDGNRMARLRAAFLEQPWGHNRAYHVLDGEQPVETSAALIRQLVEATVRERLGKPRPLSAVPRFDPAHL